MTVVGALITYLVRATREAATAKGEIKVLRAETSAESSTLSREIKGLTDCIREGFDELKEMYGDHEDRIRQLERIRHHGPHNSAAAAAGKAGAD